ncbi:MAG: M15 family metallopeptidase [Actinomycetota bacterium]|nr:M15 family metallopeptidase [Actinomycetota bacterium]
MAPFRARFAPVDPSPEAQAPEVTASRRELREAAQASRPASRRPHLDLRPWIARGAMLGALVAITIVAPATGMVLPGNGTIVAGGARAAYAPGELPSVVDALAKVPASDRVPDLLAFTETFDERIILAATRASERDGIPGCDPTVLPTGSNGQLTQAGLCVIPWSERYTLRSDAATALAAMNQAYRVRFDKDLCLASGYRTIGQQRYLKSTKGRMAAPAGKSNHGWGLAVDFCRSTITGESMKWLQANGPTFGWEQPPWAVPGGRGPIEAWHWELYAEVKKSGEVNE